MLLNAVIIILQEVLEASLLISVLMAMSHALQLKLRWLGLAVAFGFVGAFIYQYHLETISAAFDYIGQEITNATLQIIIYLLLTVTVIFLNKTPTAQNSKSIAICMMLSVSLGIIREGSEIFIYIGSFMQQKNHLLSVCTGGAIGGAIGTSLAALVYFTLLNISKARMLIAAQVMLSLIAASMLSQAVQLLIQADILPAHQPLWDSSNLLSENSITGQLLYAIAGYEATPTAIQASAYIFALTSILFFVFYKKLINRKAVDE